jgi:capsular polysaccharide biosynthesis protein
MSMLELDSEKPRPGTDLTNGRTGLAQGTAGLATSKTLRNPKRLGPESLKQQVPALELEHTDLRAHYEMVAARALSSIKRDWRLIASIVAVTMALACLVIPLIPRQYSATALVYPNLFSVEQAKLTPKGSIDASSLVTSEARLIVSDAILEAVVTRLKLDGMPGVIAPRSWVSGITSWIRTLILPETRNHSPFDRQVALLRNRVDVAKDTRSYLISISFAAGSPDEAAAVVNAIALEYVRDKKVLRSLGAVAAAEGELQRQLAINGERHPKVLQSVDGLESARAELNAVLTAEDATQEALAADEGIKLAIPNRTPTSPKGFVILGLSFIVSLLAGVGLAVWRDRLGFEPRQFLLGFMSTGRRYGQQIAGGSLGRNAGGGTRSFQVADSRAGWTTDKWRRLRAGFASLVQRAFGPLRLGGGLMGQRRRPQEGQLRRPSTGRSKRII